MKTFIKKLNGIVEALVGIATIALLLLCLLVIVWIAAMILNSSAWAKEPAPVAEPTAAEDRLPGEDTEAHGYAYLVEDPLYYRISAEDRATLEHIVEGEAGGESYDGKRWVATCLLNAMRKDGMNAEEVRTAYQYVGWSEDVSDETIHAVSQVFDFGDVTHDTVLWFYAPQWCSSPWHEGQQFVAEIGGHRFFCPWESDT